MTVRKRILFSQNFWLKKFFPSNCTVWKKFLFSQNFWVKNFFFQQYHFRKICSVLFPSVPDVGTDERSSVLEVGTDERFSVPPFRRSERIPRSDLRNRLNGMERKRMEKNDRSIPCLVLEHPFISVHERVPNPEHRAKTTSSRKHGANSKQQAVGCVKQAAGGR